MSAARVSNPQRILAETARGAMAVMRWTGRAAPALPVLHFSHANGFNAETYQSLLAAAATHFPVMASDFRGHGHSPLPADPRQMKSWRIYADDLIALLDADGRAPYLLGGHSMGAVTALIVAIKRPDLTSGLLLIEPVILPPAAHAVTNALKGFGLYDRVLPMVRQAERRRLYFPDPETAFAAYRGRGAFKSWPDAIVRDYLRGGLLPVDAQGHWRLACAPEWEAANYRAGPPFVWRGLSALKIPVFVMVGTRNSTCPPIVGLMLQRRIKTLRVERVPGTSHFLPMERPDLVLSAFERLHAALR